MKYDWTDLLHELTTATQEAQGAVAEQIETLRRCEAVKRDGERCRAWAVYDSSQQLCSAHLHPTRRKAHEMTAEIRQQNQKHRRPTCDCSAYPFPHREGKGFCRFPDEPIQTHSLPSGQRAPGKVRRRDAERVLSKMMASSQSDKVHSR